MSAAAQLAFCRHCKRQVVVKKQPVRHKWHLLMCLITLGMWLPLYLFLWLIPSAPFCSECGADIEDDLEENREKR